jgi:homocitrate synthase NifV
MKSKRYIVDTTLRDGEQSAGIVFTIEEKVRLAKLMDQCGIYQIEAGIPAVGRVEKEAISRIMASKKRARISAWNRLSTEDIRHSMECSPDIIHIGVPVSYVQIYTKLKKNKRWLENELLRCVDMASSAGFDVTVGFEDASRADISFMTNLIKRLEAYRVLYIRFADTVGVLTPGRTADSVKNILEYTDMDMEIHVHNDLGMAVANSLEAAKSGAFYVDCTLNGIGERAGNCDFQKFVAVGERLFDFGIDKAASMELLREFSSILKMEMME